MCANWALGCGHGLFAWEVSVDCRHVTKSWRLLTFAADTAVAARQAHGVDGDLVALCAAKLLGDGSNFDRSARLSAVVHCSILAEPSCTDRANSRAAPLIAEFAMLEWRCLVYMLQVESGVGRIRWKEQRSLCLRERCGRLHRSSSLWKVRESVCDSRT